MDLQNSEIAYVYSDFRSVYSPQDYISKEDFLRRILSILLDKVETVLIPTFTYTTAGLFNPVSTITTLGGLNAFIQRSVESYTSDHPMFSFSGIGPKSRPLLENVGSEAFGHQSVFERLLDESCTFIHLGRPPYLGNTLVHRIEHQFQAPYREEIYFPTEVARGESILPGPYSAYLRRIGDVRANRYETVFLNAADFLIRKRAYKLVHYSSDYNSIWSGNFEDVHFRLAQLFEEDRSIFIRQ